MYCAEVDFYIMDQRFSSLWEKPYFSLHYELCFEIMLHDDIKENTNGPFKKIRVASYIVVWGIPIAMGVVAVVTILITMGVI